RIDLTQQFVPQAELLHGTGAEILYDNVAAADHSQEQLAVVSIFEVQRDALFAAIQGSEIRRLTVDERIEASRIVASSGMFDLDDPRAHLGQHHRAEWAGQNPCQI